jgi:hypothetical protein
LIDFSKSLYEPSSIEPAKAVPDRSGQESLTKRLLGSLLLWNRFHSLRNRFHNIEFSSGRQAVLEKPGIPVLF